jgi:lysylphosphatidylglycerol synthetase-like protein (DUF2156 family)
MQERRKSGSSFGAIIIILIGIILLLNNFAILPWSIWNKLWHFWPVILIIAGLEMLDGDSSFAKNLISLIGIIILIFVILLAIASVDKGFELWIRKQFPYWPKIYKRFENFKTRDPSPFIFDSENFSI